MNTLPPALQALADYPQFINWKAVPREDGRMDKIPLDPRTGQVCDAHNPEVWVPFEVAAATGLRVAFVFTDNDPFWFLDIDHCKEGNQWSRTARDLCGMYAGCAIEVSQSGEGLHIFGTQPPGAGPHSCDSKELGSQFYTTKRFVALTGTGIVGDIRTVPSPAVYNGFIEQYFKAGAMVDRPSLEDWTTEADPEWSGPEDDKELIGRMLKSKSARGILGSSATVKQLWEANEKALAKIYPDEEGNQGRAFDWSKADMALCSHLAFWTGKNCERMDTLFRRSALFRDKWADRDQYRVNTILLAVGRCTKVYKQRGPIQPPLADGTRVGLQFLTLQDQQQLFEGCCYVIDDHKVFVAKLGQLLKPDQFRVIFGGYLFALDALGSKTTKNAWEVFTESQAFNFPKANATCFRPELPSGSVTTWEGRQMLNIYVPVETERRAGDPGPFLDLLTRVLPVAHDRDIILSYMAACVQYPGVKFQWAPLIQGVQGNGKSFIGRALVHAIGERYTHLLNPKDIGNVFNSWLQNKLLIRIEEVYTRSDIDAVETLKWMITDKRVPIQAKGQNQTTGDNRANFFMSTNHRDAVQKTESDRRFCVFYTAQQEFKDLGLCGLGGNYFPQLYTWAETGGYAIINNYLREYKIPDELNPATSCHRAPETSSLRQALEQSRGAIEQELIEAIGSGRTGFKDGWISTMALDNFLKENRFYVAYNKRREMLKSIGYIPHPALVDGRVNNPIHLEGGKPRLFIREGHIAQSITDAATASRIYQEAQGYLIPQGSQGAYGAIAKN